MAADDNPTAKSGKLVALQDSECGESEIPCIDSAAVPQGDSRPENICIVGKGLGRHAPR
jgi:hypothetical protein